MINFSEAAIKKIFYCRFSAENNNTFKNGISFTSHTDEETGMLKKLLLGSFSSSLTTYEFKHDIKLNLNVLFTLAKSIYNGEPTALKVKDIFQHLIAVSKHPGIKDGDIFVAKMDDVKIGNKFYEALGIYKIETKEHFIDTAVDENGTISLSFKKGISGRKIDKGCLIIFSREPYTVLVVDQVSKETDYWINEFVNVRLKNDEINNTAQAMSISKDYIMNQFPREFDVAKADQIDYLNRTVDYFKTHEHFDKKDFEKEVFYHPEIISSFKKFGNDYIERNELGYIDDFTISAQVVKRKERVFKHVLKLDKNFHIYIHGDKNLIEKGTEKDGRKYYKIYYENEG